MAERSTYVGLDVHQETIAVAVADGRGEVRSLGTIPNRPAAVAKLLRRWPARERLAVCYEAGPCGYGLYRQLTELGVACTVVAPSLVPTRVGDRVKTDRRDAEKLARLHRAGELQGVWVPDTGHEALRDLTRAREAALGDQQRARQRVRTFLVRQGVHAPDGMHRWTKRHRDWLATVQLGTAEQQVVLTEAIQTLDQIAARLHRLEAALTEVMASSAHAGLMGAFQTVRGVGPITAATLIAELGDPRRFATPRQLMAYTGLVPSEHSSGRRQQRGGVTKTGNVHLRRVLVEAAWHYRHRPAVGMSLRRRQAQQPAAVVAHAWQAQVRLHRRYGRLVGRGKTKPTAVVAVARELLGFLWAIAQLVEAPVTPAVTDPTA